MNGDTYVKVPCKFYMLTVTSVGKAPSSDISGEFSWNLP